ncbi:MAG: hypothetical protein AAB217_07200 [Chloroflexota bacterium]
MVKPPRWGAIQHVLLLAVLLLILAVVAAVFGERLRNGSFPRLLPPTSSVPPSVTLIDTRNGVVLMLEQTGDVSRVIAKIPGQASWLLASQDDTTATAPALSNDGEKVAFASWRDGGHIVVVSLATGLQKTITAGEIQVAGTNLGKLQVCEWSSIVWNPKGNSVAFFACNSQRAFSIGVVSDLSGTKPALKVVVGSEIDSDETRQIAWPVDDQILVTVPSGSAQANDAIVAFNVP